MRFSKSMVAIAALTVAAALVAGTTLASQSLILRTVFSGLFNFPGSGGSLSPYLVGFYDLEDEGEAEIFLVNPTPRHLVAHVVIFDDDQTAIVCLRFDLSPNDYQDVDLEDEDLLEEGFDVSLDEGAIKILSLRPFRRESLAVVEAGLVGWIRHKIPADDEDGNPGGFADAALQSVPASLLTPAELELILNNDACRNRPHV